MGKPGPKTKATAVKEMSGTLRPHRVNEDAPEYKTVASEEAKPPTWLKKCNGSKYALEEWKRVVDLLTSSGVLQDSDLTALAHLCRLHGACLHESLRGNPVPGTTETQLRLYYAEFGLMPASRTGLKVDKPTKPTNRFARNGKR